METTNGQPWQNSSKNSVLWRGAEWHTEPDSWISAIHKKLLEISLKLQMYYLIGLNMQLQGKSMLASWPKHQQQWRTEIFLIQQKYNVRSSWEGQARPIPATVCLSSLWSHINIFPVTLNTPLSFPILSADFSQLLYYNFSNLLHSQFPLPYSVEIIHVCISVQKVSFLTCRNNISAQIFEILYYSTSANCILQFWKEEKNLILSKLSANFQQKRRLANILIFSRCPE